MSKIASVFTALICGLFILIAANNGWAANAKAASDPEIVGFWYTQDHDGGIQLYSCGDEICGRFYWLRDDGPKNISRDDHNPDPKLRTRALCRLQFMGGFEPDPDEDGRYINGWIYSPRHGKNFDAEMTLVDHDTLELHGYILLPVFGESQTWTRAEKLPKCTKK